MYGLLRAVITFGLLKVIAINTAVSNDIDLEERQSSNGTDHRSISECAVVELVIPSRSKAYLNIRLNAFGSDLYSTLHVVEDNDLISRGKTGIWEARFSSSAYQNVLYNPWPEAFDVIGNFELFQNLKEGSAVTRFWDSDGNESFVGILKRNYLVKSIPEESAYLFGNISENYIPAARPVNSMNDQDKKPLFLEICKNDGVLSEYFRRFLCAKKATLSDPNLHRSRRQSTSASEVPDVVYPKLLVIPDFGTINCRKNYRDFMMQLIGQLNSVDMMFRQLKDPEVHLNIAGIIIPQEYKATPYILKHTDGQNRIDGAAAVHEAEMNFLTERRRFPAKKWDSILMLTTNTIGVYNGVMGDLTSINGFSPIARGCAGAATIARFTENMEGLYTLTHGLGHMFGPMHDEEEVTEQCTNADGYLMATSYDDFQILEWSNCSRAAFQRYFRSAAANCTYSELQEIPDTIKGMQGPWLSVDGQCDNDFDESTGFCMFNTSPNCSIFGCQIRNTCNLFSAPLMEGSFFDDHHGRRVCVNGVLIDYSEFTQQ